MHVYELVCFESVHEWVCGPVCGRHPLSLRGGDCARLAGCGGGGGECCLDDGTSSDWKCLDTAQAARTTPCHRDVSSPQTLGREGLAEPRAAGHLSSEEATPPPSASTRGWGALGWPGAAGGLCPDSGGSVPSLQSRGKLGSRRCRTQSRFGALAGVA